MKVTVVEECPWKEASLVMTKCKIINREFRLGKYLLLIRCLNLQCKALSTRNKRKIKDFNSEVDRLKHYSSAQLYKDADYLSLRQGKSVPNI
ncbi:hypothetical protein NQ317_000265 [Molorchus minor]|uniref:Uncharacterized protein n=1 Tax=Molorchus minor TaxID=1323400 RepID=A0ABQ9JTG2_9CUCU|nr:hypothetical protein NQ317_000265 [Molorchus minor]